MNSTFTNVFIKTLKKSFTLQGRASRREQWHWLFPATSILMMGTASLMLLLYYDRTTIYVHYITIINVFLLCCFYVSSLSISIRRLHDLGHSGWLTLLNFIPFVNFFLQLYLLFKAGNKDSNKYGPVPLDQNLSGFDKIWLWTFIAIIILEFGRRLY